ncbi:MAG: DUF370 domain-containing protein [Oscillibacter sp.]|nr:DUF370 domain-containing protein [Oscillibacter sp.]
MLSKENELVSIGYGGMVSASRLIAVVGPDSAPVKRLISEARERSMLIDATFGRKTAAVLVMDSDHVILSGLPLEKLAPRFGVDPTVLEEEP